jgi:hypothetical protein
MRTEKPSESPGSQYEYRTVPPPTSRDFFSYHVLARPITQLARRPKGGSATYPDGPRPYSAVQVRARMAWATQHNKAQQQWQAGCLSSGSLQYELVLAVPVHVGPTMYSTADLSTGPYGSSYMLPGSAALPLTGRALALSTCGQRTALRVESRTSNTAAVRARTRTARIIRLYS